MKYQFNYETKAMDLWQLSMYSMYRSMVGLINIIFTGAMIGLAIKFWSDANLWIRLILILGMGLFTVIQPILIYRRAKNQLSTVSKEISIGFDDYGVHVETGGKKSNLKWKTIKGIAKNPTLIIVYTTATHGFILTNKVLGYQKEAFYNDVLKKLKR